MVKRQTQVLAEMERMAGKTVGKMAGGYQRRTVGPLAARIKKAKSLKGLLRQLGPGLLKEMDSKPLENALADAEVQSGLIGRVSALPRRKMNVE